MIIKKSLYHLSLKHYITASTIQSIQNRLVIVTIRLLSIQTDHRKLEVTPGA
jgi:hypothetical protein